MGTVTPLHTATGTKGAERSSKTSESRLERLEDSALAVTLTVGQLKQILDDALHGSTPRGDSLLNAQELAQKLQVPPSWVYEQSRMGNIPTHRIGRYIRFDFHEVLEAQRKQQGEKGSQ